VSGPFSPRAALGLVAVGAIAFIAMLYAIGAGWTGGGNDGGSHALSKGLTGYAALASLLENTGVEVRRSRDVNALDDPGLLVLTPPHDADGEELGRIVAERRTLGPTLVVLPKWVTVPAQGDEARTGWTATVGTRRARWLSVIDGRLDVELGAKSVQSLTAREDGAVPLVRRDDKILIGYLNDDGSYHALDRWSGWDPPAEPDEDLHPVVIVAEPDLLDNRGLGNRRNALNALKLIRATRGAAAGPVIFDVTLNGLGRARNLLTLAFSPPFVAATLALILAALAAAWRAFVRFGPPRLAARPLAYGKTALVENSAGLIRRAGRIRLLGAPYAALVGHRLQRALGLPTSAPSEAIDAAQARRGLSGPAFTAEREALAAARKPHDLVRHAAALHAIERALSR
jgi:hypothetical protein